MYVYDCVKQCPFTYPSGTKLTAHAITRLRKVLTLLETNQVCQQVSLQVFEVIRTINNRVSKHIYFYRCTEPDRSNC